MQFAADVASGDGATPHENTRIKRQLTGLHLTEEDVARAARDAGVGESGLGMQSSSMRGAPQSTSNPMAAARTSSSSSPDAGVLRKSILKAGEGPVVSPRTALTRSLSFVDQAQPGAQLKEVRLYEKPPKAPRYPGLHMMAAEEVQEQPPNKLGMIVIVVALVALFLFLAFNS